jgi:hypothetical protein
MRPHLQPGNDASSMTTSEMFGLSVLMPEPEVARAIVTRSKTKALANVIAGLINEHEPMLQAEVDGASVVVRVRGDDGSMRLTVEDQR